MEVLRHMGAHVKSWDIINKVIDHMVLLYGCEIWVMTDNMLTVLEGLQHRVDPRLTGLTKRQR